MQDLYEESQVVNMEEPSIDESEEPIFFRDDDLMWDRDNPDPAYWGYESENL